VGSHPIDLIGLTGSLWACLETGDHNRASELGHHAAEAPGRWQHCEIACLVTTAQAHCMSEGTWLPEYVERAGQLIETDGLMLEERAKRLEWHRVWECAPGD